MIRKKKEEQPEAAEQVAGPESASTEAPKTAAAADTPETATPDISIALSQEVASLTSELEETRAKMDEYLQGWQRALADFANYRRRVEREQSQANQVATGNVIKRYLDVVDDLDRALKNKPLEGDGAGWAGGIELIYRKFLAILEAEGVKLIEAEGQDFDPNLHEAISMEESAEVDSGKVIGVVQQGYILGDRVLRPARVRIAR